MLVLVRLQPRSELCVVQEERDNFLRTAACVRLELAARYDHALDLALLLRTLQDTLLDGPRRHQAIDGYLRGEHNSVND